MKLKSLGAKSEPSKRRSIADVRGDIEQAAKVVGQHAMMSHPPPDLGAFYDNGRFTIMINIGTGIF